MRRALRSRSSTSAWSEASEASRSPSCRSRSSRRRFALCGQLRRGVGCHLALRQRGHRDLAQVDVACPLRELLLRLGELPVSTVELREALLELGPARVEIRRLALDPLPLLGLRALAPLLELGLRATKLVVSPAHVRLARGELLLATRQVGPHPLDLLDLAGIGAPVPDRREPAAFGAQRPEPPSQTSLPKDELALHPLELPFADRDRGGPFPQRPLQVFEVLVRSKPVLIALKDPLRHRASNVHALCGIGYRAYDQAS